MLYNIFLDEFVEMATQTNEFFNHMIINEEIIPLWNVYVFMYNNGSDRLYTMQSHCNVLRKCGVLGDL